jgi:hypothetical protein
MEELQDAIEDAQYVNAIATQVEGPRPVLSWEIPNEEQLDKWEATKKEDASKDPNGPAAFGIDWCLQSTIGFYLFSEFLKDTCGDYLRINFIEDLLQWREMRGQQRLDRAKRLVQKYLSKVLVDSETGERIYPERREIVAYDVYRETPRLGLSDDDLKEFYTLNKIEPHDPTALPTSNCLRVSGPILDEIKNDISRAEKNQEIEEDVAVEALESAELQVATQNLPNRKSIKEKYCTMKQLTERLKIVDPSILDDLFIKVDVLVVESLRKQYWKEFTESEKFSKLKNFLWFFDRQVISDDFFSMRVLGRGGFGSVTGKSDFSFSSSFVAIVPSFRSMFSY